jgi:hypothetical protein
LVAVEIFSLLPTLTASQRLNFSLPWNSWSKNLFMLITYDKNFKAKRLIQKKILTIYQHVSFWETIVKSVSLLQLWHPPKGWKITYLLWNFFHKVISMLITFVTSFKAKNVIQKKIFKIYQHV